MRHAQPTGTVEALYSHQPPAGACVSPVTQETSCDHTLGRVLAIYRVNGAEIPSLKTGPRYDDSE